MSHAYGGGNGRCVQRVQGRAAAGDVQGRRSVASVGGRRRDYTAGGINVDRRMRRRLTRRRRSRVLLSARLHAVWIDERVGCHRAIGCRVSGGWRDRHRAQLPRACGGFARTHCVCGSALLVAATQYEFTHGAGEVTRVGITGIGFLGAASSSRKVTVRGRRRRRSWRPRSASSSDRSYLTGARGVGADADALVIPPNRGPPPAQSHVHVDVAFGSADEERSGNSSRATVSRWRLYWLPDAPPRLNIARIIWPTAPTDAGRMAARATRSCSR